MSALPVRQHDGQKEKDHRHDRPGAGPGRADIHMRAHGASSVRVATMLFKPNKLEYDDAKPDYVGREMTDEFVIGYGLDFDGFVRNLDAIYKVKDA